MNNSEKVRIAYKKSRLTYQELSELTGIKKNTLICYAVGRRNPSDVITNLIEEKVNVYLKGGGRYINVGLQRDVFMQGVYDVLSTEDARKVMELFDKLPTVSIDMKGECE